MVVNPDEVRYGNSLLEIQNTNLNNFRGVAAHVLNSDGSIFTDYPNKHVSGSSFTIQIQSLQDTGGDDPFVGVAVVEDATDTNGFYEDGSGNPQTGVIDWVPLGFHSTLSAGDEFTISGLDNVGTYRLVLTFGENEAQSRDINQVNTGGLSNDFHFDSDGNEARGGAQGFNNVFSKDVGWFGRRATVDSLNVTTGVETSYGETPSVSVSFENSVNPKNLRTGLQLESDDSRPKGVFSTGIDSNGDGTSSGVNVDTDWPSVPTNLRVELLVNDAGPETSTPSNERPDLDGVATVSDLTESERSWIVFDNSGHFSGAETSDVITPSAGSSAPNRIFNPSSNTGNQVATGFDVFKDSDRTESGVKVFSSSTDRSGTDATSPSDANQVFRFKRQSVAGSSVNATVFGDCFVFDKFGNVISNENFDVVSRPTGTSSDEDSDLGASSDGSGRLQFDITISSNSGAFNRFKGSPDDPNNHVSDFGNYYDKDSFIQGDAYSGVKEPDVTFSKTHGVNSEILFEDMWTGNLADATVDSDFVPTGAASRTKNIGTGNLRYKVSTNINESTGLVSDQGEFNPKDENGRNIDLSGSELLHGAEAVYNITLDDVEDSATSIPSDYDLDDSQGSTLGYAVGDGSDDGFRLKEASGDARNVGIYLAYADSQTQADSFSISKTASNNYWDFVSNELKDDNDENAEFSNDSGNYGYFRIVVNFPVINPNLFVSVTQEKIFGAPGTPFQINATFGRYLPSGDIVEEVTDSPPDYYVWKLNKDSDNTLVENNPMVSVSGSTPEANWKSDITLNDIGKYQILVSGFIGGSRPPSSGVVTVSVGGKPGADSQLFSASKFPWHVDPDISPIVAERISAIQGLWPSTAEITYTSEGRIDQIDYVLNDLNIEGFPNTISTTVQVTARDSQQNPTTIDYTLRKDDDNGTTVTVRKTVTWNSDGTIATVVGSEV